MFTLENDNKNRGLFPCPKCGDFIEINSKICPSCKSNLIDDIKTNKIPSFEVSALERFLFLCSNCGSFIGADATCCNVCGTKRSSFASKIDDFLKNKENQQGKQAVDDTSSDSSPDIYLCDNCGAFLGSNAEKCEVCGIVIEEFEDVEEEKKVEGSEPIEEAGTEEVLSTEGKLILCSECGAFVSPNSTACGICGFPVKDMKDTFMDSDKEPISADSRLSTSGVLFICEKCGAFLKKDAEECPICGTRISTESRIGDEQISTVDIQFQEIIEEKTPDKPRITEKDLLKEADEIAYKMKQRRTKIDIINECARLYHKKALALKKLGRYKEALKSLNNGLSLRPDESILLLEKADICYEIGRYGNALKLYTHLMESDPQNISLLNKIGNTLYRLGHQKESLSCFEKALSLDANNREALINKGYLLMRQEKYEEAMECANKILVCTW